MQSLNRRDFMKATAAGAAAVSVQAQAARKSDTANASLRAGIIGCGNIAGNHVGALVRIAEDENVQIRTACDIYETRAEQARDRVEARGGKVRVETEYRRVLDDKDIDYVVICTPEHSHYQIAMDALDAGKHVYCEKPMCYDVAEAKQVAAKASGTGLQLQVGVQGLADDSYGAAYEAIKAGKIGPVVQAQIEYVRHHKMEQGPWRKSLEGKREKPRDLDWEAWLNPRPQRDWDPHLYHEWRCYSEFSGGIATDLFVHRVSRIIRACGLGFPTRAAALGGIYMWDDGRDTPDNVEMLLEYPAIDGITPGMTVHLLGTMSNQHKIEHCIRGHDGTLVFTSKGWEIIDQRSRDVIETYTKETGEDMAAHHANHHAAIRDGAELNCPPELGLQGVAAARMGNLSWERKAMVEWDSAQQAIVLK